MELPIKVRRLSHVPNPRFYDDTQAGTSLIERFCTQFLKKCSDFGLLLKIYSSSLLCRLGLVLCADKTPSLDFDHCPSNPGHEKKQYEK